MTKLQHGDSPEDESDGEATTAAEARAAEEEEAAKVEAEAAAAEAAKIEPRDQRQDSVDFTDHEPGVDLEDEYFGHFRSTERNFSAKAREDGRFCGDGEFSRSGRGPKGWAAEPPGPCPAAILESLEQERERQGAPSVLPIAPPAPRSARSIPNKERARPAQYLHEERAQFYAQHTARRVQAVVRRGYRPSKALEAQRLKKVAPKRFKKSPLLTNEYLYGTPRPGPGGTKRWSSRVAPQEGAPKSVRHALQDKPFAVKSQSRKEDQRAELQVLLAQFEAEGGKVRIYSAEKTAAQIKAAPKKMGRPTKYGYVMSDAERQRHSRANRNALAAAPNSRSRPGANERSPIAPVAPGHFLDQGAAMRELELLSTEGASLAPRMDEGEMLMAHVLGIVNAQLDGLDARAMVRRRDAPMSEAQA